MRIDLIFEPSVPGTCRRISGHLRVRRTAANVP